MRPRLFLTFISLLLLPLLVYVALQVQQYLSRAGGIPANLAIDTRNTVGPLTPMWASFAQGGEEPPPMLTEASLKLKELSPRYIRLDHIFDYYNIVQKDGNSFRYDFRLLDETVNDILKSGAIPFFSLSYMPSVFTASGQVIDAPVQWQWWTELVKSTIEHYSGKSQKNLSGVYYEVWNEPELPQFGSWKINGGKDYRLLYYHAALGAEQAADTNIFFFGGPGVGSYYPEWARGILSYVSQNKLRLDFYSWHRYHKSPGIFLNDAQNTRKIMSSFPGFSHLPLIISEWGIDSENTTLPNTNESAAFTIVSVARMSPLVAQAFQFEIKDGPPPNGGKWGLLTHEKATSPLSPKPRFFAYQALSALRGESLRITGAGTYVDGVAAKEGENVQVVIANYDLSGRNTEAVPVTFTGLDSSSYQLSYRYMLGEESGKYEQAVTNGAFNKSFLMKPNTILLLELEKLSPLATFVDGRGRTAGDKALVLTGDNTLVFQSPEFRLRPEGTVQFDIKPFWNSDNTASFPILEIPYSLVPGEIRALQLSKRFRDGRNELAFSIVTVAEIKTVTMPIDSWVRDSWYIVSIGWKPNSFSLSISGNTETAVSETDLDLRGGSQLIFHPVPGALDNLFITVGEEQTIQRSFDGTADR